MNTLRSWYETSRAPLVGLMLLGSVAVSACEPTQEDTGTIYSIDSAGGHVYYNQCNQFPVAVCGTVEADIPEGTPATALQTGQFITIVSSTVQIPRK